MTARAPRKSKSKYAHVIDKLPRLFNLEAAYQERVDQMKLVIAQTTKDAGHPLDATTLAYIYEDFRTTCDELEAELHEANLKLEAAAQMLANEFDARGISTVKLENGASVQSYAEPHAVVKDPEKYRQWCIKNGYENRMTLPWMTTNAIVKERLLEGEPEPDGVEAIARPKVVFKAGA